jgi:hypothetical protein
VWQLFTDVSGQHQWTITTGCHVISQKSADLKMENDDVGEYCEPLYKTVKKFLNFNRLGTN